MTPRAPIRPLIWPDAILDLADALADVQQPVYIVGGAVRDAYFGLPLHDADLVTPEGATALARRIADLLKGDVYVMDAERDVARVLADTPQGRLSIDVAAFRAPDLLADLTERDFTINAMAVDLRALELLIDPLDGETDLIHRLIRRCTEHAVARDPIRALRAVRQSVQLSGHIEKQTMHDARANAGRLYDTSPERVRDEFMKILALGRPATALRVMSALGLLAPILPDVAALPSESLDGALRTVEHLTAILNVVSPRRTDNTAAAFGLGALVVALDRFRGKLQDHFNAEWPNERPHTALLTLAALLRAAIDANPQTHVSAFTDSIVAHLRLSNPERVRLLAILRADTAVVTAIAPLDALAQHRYWFPLGAAGIDGLVLTLARYLSDTGVGLERDAWVRILERTRLLLESYFLRHDTVVAPPLFADGNVLMSALGLKPGPVIRELLDHIREAQVSGTVTDAETALAAAREYLRR